MKCLSLWQPWASLIAYGHKRVETRDWPTRHRGLILIHAAKRWTAEEREAAQDLWPRYAPRPDGGTLPLGALVAVATLVDCVMMTSALIAAQTEQEEAMGAWCAGRWAWQLGAVARFDKPVPLRGRQGLFDVTIHDVGRDAWTVIEEGVARMGVSP